MEANPVLVLEFAGKGKKSDKDEDAETKQEALTLAAKKVRNAKSDKDYASALMDFISLCQYSESEED